jgi:hypothetical protein
MCVDKLVQQTITGCSLNFATLFLLLLTLYPHHLFLIIILYHKSYNPHFKCKKSDRRVSSDDKTSIAPSRPISTHTHNIPAQAFATDQTTLLGSSLRWQHPQSVYISMF